MKRLLTLLLALPITATAQKLQLGLNAGTQYNLPTAYGTVKGRINGYASAKALTHLGKHLQLGFAIDVGKITLGSSDAIYTDESQTSTNGLVYIIASPYIMPTAVVNYKIRLPKSYLYGGTSLGYMKGFKGNSDIRFVTSKQLGPTFGPSTIVGSRMAIASYNAISLGLQAGYVYQLKNKLGLNAEVGIRWLRAASSDYFFEARDKFVPVSLGVRYTLGTGLGKKG